MSVQLDETSVTNLNKLKFVQNVGEYQITDNGGELFGSGQWEDEFTIQYQVESALMDGHVYFLNGLELEYYDESRNAAAEYEFLGKDDYIQSLVKLKIYHNDEFKTIYPHSYILYTGTHNDNEIISGNDIATIKDNHYKHEPCLFNEMRVVSSPKPLNGKLFQFTFKINELHREGHAEKYTQIADQLKKYYQDCFPNLLTETDKCNEEKQELDKVFLSLEGQYPNLKEWQIDNPFYHWCKALVFLFDDKRKDAESSYEYYIEYINLTPQNEWDRDRFIVIEDLIDPDKKNEVRWNEIKTIVDNFVKKYRDEISAGYDQSILAENFSPDPEWYDIYKKLTKYNVNSLSTYQKSLNKINNTDKDYTFDYRYYGAIISINMNDMDYAKKLISNVRNAISSAPILEEKDNNKIFILLDKIYESKNIQLESVELWDTIDHASQPEKISPVSIVFKNKYNYSVNLFSSNDRNYKKNPRKLYNYDQQNSVDNIVYPGGRYLVIPNTKYEVNDVVIKNSIGGVALLALSFGIMSLSQ